MWLIDAQKAASTRREINLWVLSTWNKYDRSDSFVTQTEFYLAHNQKEDIHYDHIPFNFGMGWKYISIIYKLLYAAGNILTYIYI